MGKVWMPGSGGGVASSDVTANRGHVLRGFSTVTVESNDEVVEGLIYIYAHGHGASSVTRDDASATLYYHIPAGCYITDDNNTIGGTTAVRAHYSPVRDAIGLTAAKLLQGQNVLGIAGSATGDANIAAGDVRNGRIAYARGARIVGTLNVPTLASLTGDASAVAGHILTGKTAYARGAKITGTMDVSSIVSFSAAPYSTSQVLCTWTNPTKGPYGGFVICAKKGSYPVDINDNRVFTGAGNNHALGAANSTTIGNLEAGQLYYITIWAFCNMGHSGWRYSPGRQATATPTAHGRRSFTASGTFTVPANVRSINVHCTGGGGGGGLCYDANGMVGSGGGGGGYTTYINGIGVTPGETLGVTVGMGGPYGSESQDTVNLYGGDSKVTRNTSVLAIAKGGGSAYKTGSDTSRRVAWVGGDGGSGGGGGRLAIDSGNYKYLAGTGGSDGAHATSRPGDTGLVHPSGDGQGRTTREFGLASGTLCSGGGGGALANTVDGQGGAGGGGKGSTDMWVNGENGSTGTGGGGGGVCFNKADPGVGGSGNVIFTW